MSLKKWLWLSLLVFLASFLLLPFTAGGTHLLIAVLDRVTPLQVTYSRGSLGGRLQLRDLHLRSDGTEINLNELKLELDINCLLASKLCFDELALGQVDIALIAGQEGSDQGPIGQGDLIEFPVAVETKALTVQAIRVRWPGGAWDNGSVRGGLAMSGSRVSLSDVSMAEARLAMDATAPNDEDRGSDMQLPPINLPLELVVNKLVLSRPGWRFGELTHRHESLLIALRWREDVLVLERVGLSSEGWGSVALAGRLELKDDWPLQLQAQIEIGQPPVWAGLHERDLELSLNGSLADLSVRADMPGAQHYQFVGHLDGLDPDIPFELELNATWHGQLSLLDLPGMVADPPDLQLNSPWRLRAAGSMLRQSILLTGAATSTEYAGLELQVDAVHQASELTLRSVELHDTASDSALNLSGSVAFDDALRWDVNIASTGITTPALGDLPGGRLSGSMTTRGEVVGERWRSEFEAVAVRGTIGDKPAQAMGRVTFDNELRVGNSDLNLVAGDARLALLAGEGTPPQLELVLEDLGLWFSGSRGSVRLSSTLTDDQQRLVFHGDARELVWQGVTVASAQLEGFYARAENRDFELSVLAGSANYEQWQMDGFALDWSGNENSQALKLQASGDVATSLQFTGQRAGEGWVGQLLPTSLMTPLGQWQLARPVDFEWAGATGFGMADHCWREPRASLCLKDVATGDSGGAGIEFRGDLQLFDGLIPQDAKLAGEFDVSIDARWDDGGEMVAQGMAGFSGGSFSQLVGEDEAALDWDKVSITGELADDSIRLAGEFWRDQIPQLNFDADLPRGRGQEISARFAFTDFSLFGILKPFVPILADHSGALNGNLKLSGTPANPLLNGQLSLRDGRLSVVGNPTPVENLNLTIDAMGKRAEILGSVMLGGGDTTLTGNVVLDPEPRLELAVAGKEQTLQLPPGIQAIVSENLNLVALNSHLELKGKIIVHEGELEHEQLPAGSVDVSADIVEVDYSGKVVDDAGPFDFAADVQVQILDAFNVVGTGLTTTVGGKLDLQKKSSEPLQLFGQLNILKGKIEAFGQLLSIKQGSVSFVGEPDNPDLNLRAERDIAEEKIKVRVEVLGPLDGFSFRVSSVPSLSEAQAMSYLIRGRGLDEGAEADGAALALSLGLGAVNQTGIVEGINNIPGLSKVTLGTAGEAGDTTATVSGYVGERLYLAYGVGVYEPINVLTTRLYLQTQLWLEVVSSLESSVDLYYSFTIE